MRVLFNEARALEVFQVLERLWTEQQGIFQEKYLPQNLYELPRDRQSLVNYLFYGCIPMRGAVNSDNPFKMIWTLFNKYPDLFDPKAVATRWSLKKIAEAFQEVGTITDNGEGHHREIGAGSLSYNYDNHIRYWHHNSVVLARYWNGDALSIFKGISDFEDAFTRINYKGKGLPGNGHLQLTPEGHFGFSGMRRKIFALFTIWLQEKRLIPMFPTPIPVDFHAFRILWDTNIISFEDLKPFVPKTDKQPESLRGRPVVRVTESIVDQIMKWSQRFFASYGISHMAINPALWILSRQLCALHPQSRTRDQGITFIDPESLKKPENWPTTYQNTCGHCQLERFCDGIVPAGIYYDKGFLVRLDRARYPQQTLPMTIVFDRGHKRSPLERLPSLKSQEAFPPESVKLPTQIKMPEL